MTPPDFAFAVDDEPFDEVLLERADEPDLEPLAALGVDAVLEDEPVEDLPVPFAAELFEEDFVDVAEPDAFLAVAVPDLADLPAVADPDFVDDDPEEPDFDVLDEAVLFVGVFAAPLFFAPEPVEDLDELPDELFFEAVAVLPFEELAPDRVLRLAPPPA